MRVLEIGPDAPGTYRGLVPVETSTWDTLDIGDEPGLTYAASAPYDFPIESDSYDVVLSGQVIEHVAHIWRWMPEVSRVTRPGGTIVTIAPCSWPKHNYPIDCWRIYPEGMRALLEDAGLEVELVVSEALEQPGTRVLPGRSREWQPPRVRRVNRLLRWAKLPVEQSVDTIAIARKPLVETPSSVRT